MTAASRGISRHSLCLKILHFVVRWAFRFNKILGAPQGTQHTCFAVTEVVIKAAAEKMIAEKIQVFWLRVRNRNIQQSSCSAGTIQIGLDDFVDDINLKNIYIYAIQLKPSCFKLEYYFVRYSCACQLSDCIS